MYDACCTKEESDWFMFHGSQEGRETHPPGILLENSKKKLKNVFVGFVGSEIPY